MKCRRLRHAARLVRFGLAAVLVAATATTLAGGSGAVAAERTGGLAAAAAAAHTLGTLSDTSYRPADFTQQPYVGNGYLSQRLPAIGEGYRGNLGEAGWPIHDQWFTGAFVSGVYSLSGSAEDNVKAGPPPHVHDQGEEVFYILDGEMALQLGDQVVIGTSGQLVRIPACTPHAFAVRTETARVLNFYVPAALDLEIAMLGTPATSAILPPPGAQQPPTTEQEQAFAQRCTTWPPKPCPPNGTCSESTGTMTPRTRPCPEPAHCRRPPEATADTASPALREMRTRTRRVRL